KFYIKAFNRIKSYLIALNCINLGKRKQLWSHDMVLRNSSLQHYQKSKNCLKRVTQLRKFMRIYLSWQTISHTAHCSEIYKKWGSARKNLIRKKRKKMKARTVILFLNQKER